MDSEVRNFINFVIEKLKNGVCTKEQLTTEIQFYIDKKLPWNDFETEETEMVAEALCPTIEKVGVDFRDLSV